MSRVPLLPLPVVLLALAGASPAAARSAPPLSVSGVPKVIGRGQAFLLNASGTVPASFVGPGRDGVSVLVTAVQDEHVPKGSCAADDGDYRGVVLLARNVTTEHFSLTKRVRIRSDLDYSDGQRHPYRVCVLVFPNPLRKGQDATQATTYEANAARPRLTEHHVAGLPTPVSGRVATQDGTGVGGVLLRTANGATAVTADDGRYTVLVRRGTTTLTPSLAGTHFAPASRTVRAPATRAVDFTATPAG